MIIAVIHTRTSPYTRFSVIRKLLFIPEHQVYHGNIAIIHTRNSPYTMLTVVTIAVIHTRSGPYTRFAVVAIAVIHTRTIVTPDLLW